MSLGEATEVKFGSLIGIGKQIANPVLVVIDDYQAVEIRVTIYDEDTSLTQPYELVRC